MRKLTRSLVLAMPLIVVSGVLAYSAREISQTRKMPFPPGNWTFSAHPYMGDGYSKRPVVVTSVASDARTLSVTSIRINNISSRRVSAVKLGWFLRDETNRSKTLGKGETSLIAIDPALAANSDRILNVQIVSFLEIHRPLIKKGRLDGSYRIEVGVTQVLFDDQSSWKVGEAVAIRAANGERIVNVLYSKALLQSQ